MTNSQVCAHLTAFCAHAHSLEGTLICSIFYFRVCFFESAYGSECALFCGINLGILNCIKGYTVKFQLFCMLYGVQ